MPDYDMDGSGYEEDTRCDSLTVLSHTQNVIESTPDLNVKLEGPLNYKEWKYEFTHLVSQWDRSYRHYLDGKLTVNGKVAKDVRSYYVGFSHNNLQELAGQIDLTLRILVLHNLKKEKLHFHATPGGDNDFHGLMAQVEKACSRDPIMSKVGDLRSLAVGYSNNELADRHVRIYGSPDWKLEVIAGTVDPSQCDERLLRKVIKKVEESNLDEEFNLIERGNNANLDNVERCTNAVIAKLAELVHETLNSEENILPFSIQHNASILLGVRKRLIEGGERRYVISSTSTSFQSSNSEVVTCDFLWSTGMLCHSVNDASLLRDAREAEVELHVLSPPIRTKVGSMRVEFPGGLKVTLNNVAYVPNSRPAFSHGAARKDGIHLLLREDDLFLENNGMFLCTHGPKLWVFDIKIERKCPSHPTLTILSFRQLGGAFEIIDDYDEDDKEDGIDRNKLPPLRKQQRAVLKLHRMHGHPDVHQFRSIKKPLNLLSEKAFSPHSCKACCLSKPMIGFPAKPEGLSLIQRPLETTHIGIYECFKASYDGSRFILTIVDDCTMYTTVHLLKTKAEALLKIEDYISTYSRLFGAPWRHISHDNDPELGPQIDAFCKLNRIHLLAPESFTLCGTERIADRWRRVIMDKASRLLNDARVPIIFWPAAVRQAVNQINMTPMATLGYNVPFNEWKSFAPSLIKPPRLEVFGVMVDQQPPNKIDDFGCYLGPTPDNSGHLILSHYLRQIVEVDDFVLYKGNNERVKFFFRTYMFRVSGLSKDAEKLETVKALIRQPSNYPIDLELKDDDLQLKRSLLAELF